MYSFSKKPATECLNNLKSLSKFITVNYKYGGPKMATAIKNMDKPAINMTKSPEDMASRVNILFGKTSARKIIVRI